MKRELTSESDLQALADCQTKVADEPTPLPTVISAAELYSAEITPLRPLFDRLLWDGLTMLIARPKAGKSWLTLPSAIHVAAGRPVEGLTAIDPGHVLYRALEEPKARTMARLRKLAVEGDWTARLGEVTRFKESRTLRT